MAHPARARLWHWARECAAVPRPHTNLWLLRPCTRPHATSTSEAATPVDKLVMIRSLDNDLVKHCVKLRTSNSYRSKHSQFLLTGLDLLEEAAGGRGGHIHAQQLIVPQRCTETRSGQATWLRPPWLRVDRVAVVTDSVLAKITGLDNVDSVTGLAVLDMPPYVDLAELAGPASKGTHGELRDTRDGAAKGARGDRGSERADSVRGATAQTVRTLKRVLALDGVQDPGNLGTLIRSAQAFGWDAVYLLPKCCSPYNEKAVRASRGAVFRTRLASGSLETLLQVCDSHGLRLLAAQPEGSVSSQESASSAHQAKHTQGVCLVLGSEGQGVTEEVAQVCTPVSIPMPGSMESLNVGVAGSVLMFVLCGEAHTQLMDRITSLDIAGRDQTKPG